MTQLLGSQDCVESLRKDLIDLQGTVVEVFSRTGAVLFPSWKFPDKLSCSLDLVKLLEQYDYTEGEPEINQLSHLVLLELLIDRLMLLLQSFNTYTEMMLGRQRTGKSGKTGPCVSLGPVVKRYWDNLVQLMSQKHQKRSSSENRQQIPSPESQCSISNSDISTSTPKAAFNPKFRNNTSSTLKNKAQNSSYSTSYGSGFQKSGLRSASPALSSTVPSAADTGTRTCSVSCQTAELAQTPCEICMSVQSSLKESANAVVLMYKSLGQTCSMQHLLVAMEDTVQVGRLSACNVAQWAEIQRRDMGRLGEYIMEIQEELGCLKERVSKSEEERERVREELRREEECGKREMEESRRREEEWQQKVQEVQRRAEEELREQQEQQQHISTALEKKISELKGQLELQLETQESLELERDSLQEEVQSLRQQEERWRAEKERRRSLEAELSTTHILLEKERAKCNTSQHQNQAFQVKQQALLERVSALFQQCEDLQSHLQECEDKKSEITETLTHTTQERDALQHQLTQQKSQCDTLNEERDGQKERLRDLEETVSRLTEDLQQAAERERVLVAFPELDPQQIIPQSTGDVFCDMEQQMKANLIRIRMLEKENTSLSTSLTKVRHNHDLHLPDTPTPFRGGITELSDPRNPQGGNSNAASECKTRTHPSSSSSPALHVQTVCVSLKPSLEQTYNHMSRAARVGSAGARRRRK